MVRLMIQNIKIVSLILGSWALTSLMIIPSAYGQATTWSFTASLDTTNGNGIVLRNIKHSNNLILDRIDMPYIYVLYPDGWSIYDHQPFPVCSGGGCWGKTDHPLEKHTFSGGEYWHAIFFNGCQIWSPSQWNCYKYEQQYWIFNSQSGGKPEIQMWLRAWGPGYYFEHGGGGPPTRYDVYWRGDTDILGATDDRYQVYSGSWTAVNTEAGFTSIGTTDGGIEWRTYSGTDTTKRAEIWPVLSDFSKLWMVRFKNTDKNNPIENDGNPDAYLADGQSLAGFDDLYWMRTSRPGSQCIPTSPCSQVHVITLSGL